MVRTQIQLSTRMYEGVKRIAREEESSLTEVIRRAVGDLLRSHPEAGHCPAQWAPPVMRDPGRILAPESEWRALVNEGEVPAELMPLGKRT
jgi:hypothetical protein